MANRLGIRPLTDDERLEWNLNSLEAVQATQGAFRDAVALMHPFFDPTCQTAYTDRYCRVGVGPWFFKLTQKQKRAAILHETMHVLNQHFTRAEALSVAPQTWNIAGDFEINCTLAKVQAVDISMGVLPNKKPYTYEPNHSMEWYISAMNQDPDAPKNQNGNGSNDDCQYEDDEDSNSGNQGSQSGQQDSGDQGNESGEQGSGNQGEGNSDSGSGESSQSGSGQGNSENSQGESSGQGSGSGSSSNQNSGNGQGSNSNSGGSSNSNGNQSGKRSAVDKDGNPKKCINPNHDHSGDNAGQGNAVCDRSSDSREEAADEAGIPKSSSSEQAIAKQNTMTRIQEVLAENKAKNRGDGHLDDFLRITLDRMKPAKVNWRTILRKTVASHVDSVVKGKTDYSFTRPNRRFANSQFIFPGFVRYNPKTSFAIDTSGSMGMDDYRRLLAEIEGILKETSRNKNGLQVFTIDTEAGKIQTVRTLKDVNLTGGGGTDMSVGWKFMNVMGRKKAPDLFVLATDGYTDWERVISEMKPVEKWFKSIILVTEAGGYSSVPEKLKKMAIVIDISAARKD